jgi:uncharacterized lipoprotein YddW (UPF0748 family)
MMFVGSCVTPRKSTTSPSTSTATKIPDEPPDAPREFRGVWVATVGNIDWPSKPALPTEQQKKEAIAILDRCADLNINAVILQVRPAADALYHSDLEPWSYYLTGEQGKAPSPYYDPLKFWIDEAHKRGIELHAWFNPYRAKAGSAKYALAPNHIANVHPELVREFNGWQWMDPGEPAARDWTVPVFMDVAKRYDVDALHIDDYFYPYPDYLNGKDFPDDDSYHRYEQVGGSLSRDDWRRDSINTTIRRIYQGLKKEKRWVQFGISPFGLGHQRPAVVKGFDPYEKLYADTELWLQRGWCDYLTPQLYWKISSTSQPFELLLKFWVDANPKRRNIYAGLFTGKAAFPDEDTPSTQPTQPTTRRARRSTAWDVREILNQVKIARETPGASGAVHFSMKSLMNPAGVASALKKDLYKDPALVPASPWLDNDPPPKPTVTAHASGDGLHVTWTPGWGEKAFVWAVWEKRADGWKFHVYPSDARAVDLPGATAVCVSAVDRCGNESKRAMASASPARVVD